MACKKYRYETETDARKGLLLNWKSKTQEYTLRSFYKCKKCEGFHLTKIEPGGLNKI